MKSNKINIALICSFYLLTLSHSFVHAEDDRDKTNSFSNNNQTTQATQATGQSFADSSNNSSSTNSYKLQSIVTTATGFKQDQKDAPASITVVPKEEILTRPIKDLGDAIQDVPGVYAEATKTGQTQIYMRGLSSSYTLILIDGKRQNVNGGFEANGFNGAHTSFMPPLSMIERIEVIRGPASVVYGADALGGVINIITKKNPEKFTGSVMVESTIQEQRENWGDNYGANAYVASPVIKDKLFMNLRASGKYSQPSYFYSPIPSNNGNPYSTHSPGAWYNYNAGGRISYTPNAQNNIYLDGEFYHLRNTSLNTSGNSVTSINGFNKANISLSHDGEYSWGKLQSYAQYTLTQRIPQTNGGQIFGGDIGLGNPLNWASLRQNDTIVLSSMYNNDFDFREWGDLAFTGGLYYLYEQLYVRADSFNRDQHQFAAFAEAQYFITDQFSTTLGLRYNYANLYSAMPTPRFFINYNPTKWLTFKAGVAGGFLTPNLSESYNGLYNISTTNEYQYGYYGLQAEKSWNYEFSIIFDTDPVYINLTGFYTDFTDQIQTLSATQGASLPGGFTCPQGASVCHYFENVDRSLVTGAEASLQTKPFWGVSFDAAYSFTYTKQLSGANAGLPVNAIPMHKLMAKINYKYENFFAYLRLQGNFMTPTLPSNRGGNPREILGEFYRDYVLLDLALNYKFFKHYILTFSINNLLNTNFLDYRFNSAQTSYVNAYQRHLPGRNYWISLRVEW